MKTKLFFVLLAVTLNSLVASPTDPAAYWAWVVRGGCKVLTSPDCTQDVRVKRVTFDTPLESSVFTIERRVDVGFEIDGEPLDFDALIQSLGFDGLERLLISLEPVVDVEVVDLAGACAAIEYYGGLGWIDWADVIDEPWDEIFPLDFPETWPEHVDETVP
jgi:hypothetical protein